VYKLLTEKMQQNRILIFEIQTMSLLG